MVGLQDGRALFIRTTTRKEGQVMETARCEVYKNRATNLKEQQQKELMDKCAGAVLPVFGAHGYEP